MKEDIFIDSKITNHLLKMSILNKKTNAQLAIISHFMKNMQKTTFIFLLLILASCKKEGIELYEAEIGKFETHLNDLYKESEINSEKVISKADSLLLKNESETDPIKSQIKKRFLVDLHYLKAELYYKLGKYEKSLNELKFENGGNEIAFICNYVKLKKFDKAKSILDSIPNYTFNTFIYANFYETIGKRKEALDIYKSIQKDKGINHFVYYKLSVKRIEELEKENPILLNNVYFPTGRPDFEVCDADNENRTKIMELIGELQEVQNLKNWNSTEIFEAPKDNDKNYYWIKVSDVNRVKFNFFVYQKTFEIKYYNEKNKTLLSLEEWRKKNKNDL
jgi:tetratricopeptide (TPR) repeat protein